MVSSQEVKFASTDIRLKKVRPAKFKPPTASNIKMVVDNTLEVKEIKIEIYKFKYFDV